MQQTKWINNKAPHLNNNWKFGGRKSAPARERKSQTINLYIISMLWIWQKWATQYTDEQVSWLLFFFTTMSHVLYCTISIYMFARFLPVHTCRAGSERPLLLPCILPHAAAKDSPLFILTGPALLFFAGVYMLIMRGGGRAKVGLCFSTPPSAAFGSV